MLKTCVEITAIHTTFNFFAVTDRRVASGVTNLQISNSIHRVCPPIFWTTKKFQFKEKERNRH